MFSRIVCLKYELICWFLFVFFYCFEIVILSFEFFFVDVMI